MEILTTCLVKAFILSTYFDRLKHRRKLMFRNEKFEIFYLNNRQRCDRKIIDK